MKLAKRFKSWSTLHNALALLNDENFATASDDYRTQFNHSFPRRIEVGYTSTFQQGASAVILADTPPLFIDDPIPALATQYGAAVDCYNGVAQKGMQVVEPLDVVSRAAAALAIPRDFRSVAADFSEFPLSVIRPRR